MRMNETSYSSVTPITNLLPLNFVFFFYLSMLGYKPQKVKT